MKRHLFPEIGKFYKANLHMHTTISDGSMTPEETKEAYLKEGYSIVAFTDHEVIAPHPELTDENFIAITSTEFSATERVSSDYNKNRTYHLNYYAKDPTNIISSSFQEEITVAPHLRHTTEYVTEEMKKYHDSREYSVEHINDMIARANREGFLVSYNHPVWSTQNYTDYADLKGIWGVEWYNTGCVRTGYPDTIQPIDDLLRLGERVFPLATDDAHGPDSAFGGFVMVKAAKLEYTAVMDALERGDFYSSSGPLIEDLWLDGNVLHLTHSPAVAVDLCTERRYCRRKSLADRETFTETEFDLTDYFKLSEDHKKNYFRLCVTDRNGERAHTRAYFLDELD